MRQHSDAARGRSSRRLTFRLCVVQALIDEGVGQARFCSQDITHPLLPETRLFAGGLWSTSPALGHGRCCGSGGTS
jgi:hypothetical protein